MPSTPDAGPLFLASTRASTREAFFADVKNPTGKDLARLDLTAAALDVLDSLLEALPAEQRFTKDAQARLAMDSAAAFVESVHSPGKPEPRKLAVRMARLFATAGAPEEVCGPLGKALLGGFVRFTELYCFICPVSCLTQPEKLFEEDYRADEHPAGLD